MNLTEFINFISIEIGWQKSDIQRRVRSLRDEGLIGTEYSKYGKNANQIEIYDCCYILIAILVDGNSSTVASKAREIANIKITTDRKYCLDPLLSLENFKSSFTDITFIDALCKIIDDINYKKELPAVEKITLTFNYFNPEEINTTNCRVRIDWNTPLENKDNLSKIAYGIKKQLTELDSADQMGSIVQTFIEIENSKEIPDLPDSVKILQSNFGISFDQLSSLNNTKKSEFKNKIINDKYLEATNNNKLFGNESLPNFTNHYSLGGKIFPLIAENYINDLSDTRTTYSRYSDAYSMESLEDANVYAKITKPISKTKVRHLLSKVMTNEIENNSKKSIVKRFQRVIHGNKKNKKEKRNIYLWDRDESILAWDLLLANETLPQSKDDESIINLSKLLGKIGRLKGYEIDDKYRNPIGVYLTIMNMERFKKADVLNLNIRSNLGEVAENIWMEYRENPQALIAKSKVIKEQIEKGIYEPLD